MKTALSFIAGVVVCSLLIYGLSFAMPIRAETMDNPGASSENVTFSLLNLLPDIERVYRESLTLPFIKAQSKIYDPDIAEFYQELLDKTVLYEPEDAVSGNVTP